MKIITTCFTVFALSTAVHAQTPSLKGESTLPATRQSTQDKPACNDCCGTVLTPEYLDQIHRMIDDGSWQEGKNQDLSANRGITYVKTTFHIMKSIGGNDGLNTNNCQIQIDYLNEHIEGTGLEFCISEILVHELSNPEVTYPTGPTFGFVPGTMNVYCTPQINHDFGLCGYAQYPTGTTFVVQNDCMDSGDTTFSHEAGHYFGLPHTFEGTESGSNPECVDGSNCEVAGDYFCDTDADDNGGWNWSCNYTGGGTDVCNGTPYSPDSTNLMSYAPDWCTTEFSEEQKSMFLWQAQTYRGSHLSDEACVSTGACCNEFDSCLNTYEYMCEDVGWNWQGLGTICADGCLQNTPGACCAGTNGGCIHVTEAICLSGSGTFLGPNTLCSDGGCEPSNCEGDTDDSGVVDVGDLLAVIDQWGNTSGSGDVNSDGSINVNDLLMIVGNWGPCE